MFKKMYEELFIFPAQEHEWRPGETPLQLIYILDIL